MCRSLLSTCRSPRHQLPQAARQLFQALSPSPAGRNLFFTQNLQRIRVLSDNSFSNSINRTTPSKAISLSTTFPTKISRKVTSNSRQKEFQQHFSQIDPDELINSYSCALLGDISIQGHLFITTNYFAFYSSVCDRTTKLLIPIKSVKTITKEKTARIIPNGIAIAAEKERHVFGSLISRNSIFKLMKQVWEEAVKKKEVANFPIPMEPGSLPLDMRFQTVCAADNERLIVTESVEPNLINSRLKRITPIQRIVLLEKVGILKSLLKHRPQPTIIITILLVFLAALYVSAGLLMLRIDKLHTVYLNHAYPEKVTHDRMLHYLNTNLDQIAKIRESLQSLSQHFSTISQDFDESKKKTATEPS